MMEAIPLLNQEQILVYDKVIKKVESNEGGLLFLDILNLLLAYIRKNKGVAVAIAFSGTAVALLSGRQTKHLVFKLPLTLAHGEMSVCTLAKTVSVDECSSIVPL